MAPCPEGKLNSNYVEAEPEDLAVHEAATPTCSPQSGILAKHPLENNWSLWYDVVVKKQNLTNWGDNMKLLYTFKYIEDFWGVYNNITRGSQLPSGSNYHLFKEGVKPAWEDAMNESGGKWTLNVNPQRHDEFDQKWLTMSLAMIGEQFSDVDSEEICGAVCSPRGKNLRISLWTKTGSNKPLQKAIGRRMRILLNVSADELIGFQLHETQGTRSSKNDLTV